MGDLFMSINTTFCKTMRTLTKHVVENKIQTTLFEYHLHSTLIVEIDFGSDGMTKHFMTLKP